MMSLLFNTDRKTEEFPSENVSGKISVYNIFEVRYNILIS